MHSTYVNEYFMNKQHKNKSKYVVNSHKSPCELTTKNLVTEINCNNFLKIFKNRALFLFKN